MDNRTEADQIRTELAELRAEVDQLRRAVTFTTDLADEIGARAYRRGRESVLGVRAAGRPARPRHLRAVQEGAS